MKLVWIFSRTIVGNNPSTFDDKVNEFLTDTKDMFNSTNEDGDYEMSISRQPVIFYQEDDPNKPLQGMNFVVEIYKDSDDDDDFYDYGGESL